MHDTTGTPDNLEENAMDAKSLRAAMKEKAKRLASSSSDKVDSSTFTPAEPLNADVKTGMRPISRRAFKTGGKVEGEASMARADRKPRGFQEKVGLANTNQKDANEEREGKKHIGALKTGGRVKKMGGGLMDPKKGEGMMTAPLDHSAPLPKAERTKGFNTISPADADKLMQEENRRQGDMTRRKSGGRTAKACGGSMQGGSDQNAISSAGPDEGGREAKKRGGKVWEGSAKDVAEDKKLAKKHGMSMKEWEASPEDKAHDKGKKNGGGLYANIHAKRERGEKMRKPGSKGAPTDEAFKAAERTARKDGGKVGKGKTNINIIINPHKVEDKMPMPMPAPMAAPRMPMPMPAAPAPMAPPAMPPAAGLAPMAGGMPPRPAMPMPGGMPMARKDGGKVYPKMKYGAGSGEGRLEKIEKYGKNA